MKIDIDKESLQILLDKISKSDYIVGMGESKSHLKALEEFIEEHAIKNIYIHNGEDMICGRRGDVIYVGSITCKYLENVVRPLISAIPRRNWIEILGIRHK